MVRTYFKFRQLSKTCPISLNNVSSKKAKVNKTPKSLSYFAGIFNSVLFTPQDVEIITGTPSLRRKYLDMALIQTSENYKKNLNLYTKDKVQNKVLQKSIFTF